MHDSCTWLVRTDSSCHMPGRHFRLNQFFLVDEQGCWMELWMGGKGVGALASPIVTVSGAGLFYHPSEKPHLQCQYQSSLPNFKFFRTL